MELSSGMEKHHFFAIIHKKLHRGDYLRFGRRIFIGNPNSSSYSHLCIFLSSNERRIPCGLTGRQRFFGRRLKNPLNCLRPMLRCPREARLSCWKPIASKILLTMSREPFFLRPWQIKSAHLPMARLASPTKSLSECRCSRQDVPVYLSWLQFCPHALVNVLSNHRRSRGEKLRVPSILLRCIFIKRAISHPWKRTER